MVLLVGATLSPGWAVSSQLMQFPGTGGSNSNAYTLGWVGIDGYDVFQISAPGSTLTQRRKQVHQNLQDIRDSYLQLETPIATVSTQETDNGQSEIYVNGDYLLTVTEKDAELLATTPSGVVERVEQSVTDALRQSYRERQPEYRQQQFIYGGIAVGFATAISLLIHIFSGRLLRWAVSALGATLDQDTMTHDQRHHLKDIRRLLLPVLQVGAFGTAALWILGRFPETRVIQQDLLSTLNIPIIIAIVAIIAYIGVRLTYAIVDRLLMQLTDEEGISGYYSRRARLRISTLSSVIKNISNFIWIAIGFIVALSITGVDLGLLLASVGIIGLALSLATQNLVQGAIRGFFIVLEDQFAIGDVVKIGPDAGVVENLNLRITQLRDTGGRLITIPTSDITRVANYSLHWSQADLKIPVDYNADINEMLNVTRQVSEELQNDPEWGSLILEEPQILGVDDFGDSAVIIRIWIKTQPMKQWDVSREYRRRFKLAIQSSDTTIPFPQRNVWLHPSEELLQGLQGSSDRQGAQDSDYQASGNGHQPQHTKTDTQPKNVPSDDQDAGEDGGSE
ncbi:MAG: mechanosensitive ion channel family protein [Leptolyngbyaceae cyanobacterium]